MTSEHIKWEHVSCVGQQLSNIALPLFAQSPSVQWSNYCCEQWTGTHSRLWGMHQHQSKQELDYFNSNNGMPHYHQCYKDMHIQTHPSQGKLSWYPSSSLVWCLCWGCLIFVLAVQQHCALSCWSSFCVCCPCRALPKCMVGCAQWEAVVDSAAVTSLRQHSYTQCMTATRHTDTSMHQFNCLCNIPASALIHSMHGSN